MQTEGLLRGKVVALERLESEIEQTKNSLQIRVNRDINPSAEADTAETAELRKTIADLVKTKAEIAKQISTAYQEFATGQLNRINTQPISFFQSSLESPVNFAETTQTIQKRGFDSLTTSADFFDRTNVKDVSKQIIDRISSKIGVDAFGMASNVEKDMTETNNEIVSKKDYLSSVAISAFVTTRNVRVLEPVVLSVNKIKAMVEDYEVLMDDGSLNIITETTMGGVFVGFAHILKSEHSEEKVTEVMKASDLSLKLATALGGFMSFDSSLLKSSVDNVRNLISNSGMKVRFDMYCLGALPNVESTELSYAVKQFSDYDPAKFDRSESMKGLDMATRRESMNNNIKAVIEGLSGVDAKKNNVYDIETLTKAFSSFLAAMKDDELSGVPVSLNYQKFSAKRLVAEAKAIRDKEKAEGTASSI